jgi:DNA-directed RNA polymerase specialized sigma24 family protein
LMVAIAQRQHLIDGETGSRPRPASAAVAICWPPRGRDEGARLWDVLRDLPPRQGAALLLSVGFQVPRHTVAALLGVPQPSVGWLCSRALRMLRARASVTGGDRQ